MTETMSKQPGARSAPTGRLARFPVSFFAMVMGFAGLTIGWQRAAVMLGVELGLVPWLAGLSLALFAVLLALSDPVTEKDE